MIEHLEVRHYRALRHLTVSGLSRLNVVAGRNNAGKTSLLEALFLLAAGGSPSSILNANVVRTADAIQQSNIESIRETLWKPMFSGLDTSKSIEIKACHRPLGEMSLDVSLEAADTVELALPDAGSGTIGPTGPNVPSEVRPPAVQMRLHYRHGKDTVAEHTCQLAPSGIEMTHKNVVSPFRAAILSSPNRSIQEDAVRLAELRKRKRGDVVLQALKAIEPRLLSIEDNSASGFPMIWGDIGLDELVPLPVMGEGMSRIARLVLAMANCKDGIVLVDEIENGIHHSVLAKMWHVVDEASRQFNTQVFATTHSFECVEAADAALDADVSLHRLEVDDTRCACVTYGRDDISAAIKHGLEVR